MNLAPPALHDAINEALHQRAFLIADGLRPVITYQPPLDLRWEVFRGHLLDPRHTREEARLEAWHWYLLGPAEHPYSTCLSSYHTAVAVSEEAPVAGPISPTDHPLLSLFYDDSQQLLHVVRYLLSYDWSSAGDEQAASADGLKSQHYWARELIVTIPVPSTAAATSAAAAAATTGSAESRESPELRAADFQTTVQAAVAAAVHGTNRLPITSLETPLPAFTFGCCSYLPGVSRWLGNQSSLTLPQLQQALARAAHGDEENTTVTQSEWARALEILLRAEASENWASSLAVTSPRRWLDWMRQLFHQVSLTPLTAWMDRAFVLLDALAGQSCGASSSNGADRALQDGNRDRVAAVCDLVGHMLRHLVRHLTAYDLEKFHSFGANYPDAPWLDRLLQWLIDCAEMYPELFVEPAAAEALAAAEVATAVNVSSFSSGDQTKPQQRQRQLRRRALRQGWLMRQHYEGLLVPDTPTSQGELRRVLPAEVPVVPAEQITQPRHRSNRLFAQRPLTIDHQPQAQRVLRAAVADLQRIEEYHELGMATFLDRPLGIGHAPGEVDRTPLFSYQAFSARIAQQRLAFWISRGAQVDPQIAGKWPSPEGLVVRDLPGRPRPGVTTLEDAQLAAPDFRIVSITRSSWSEFVGWLEMNETGSAADLRTLGVTDSREPRLLVRTGSSTQAAAGEPWLALLDQHLQPVTQWRLTAPQWAGRYEWCARAEWPAGGLSRLVESAAGIILCGGQSRRMGEPKAWLKLGDETFLQRLVRTMSGTVERVIVVAAVGQDLPPLPPETIVVRDQRPERGPLEGFLAGLEAATQFSRRVFVTGCDAPLLPAAVMRYLLRQLATHVDSRAECDSMCQAVVAADGLHDQPLVGAYEVAVKTLVREGLEREQLSFRALLQQPGLRVHRVGREELIPVDPQLDCLRNVNSREEYEALKSLP
ncbi:MAG: molybdenum cofactor guanylyltransferase [Planctomycetota bacterium]